MKEPHCGLRAPMRDIDPDDIERAIARATDVTAASFADRCAALERGEAPQANFDWHSLYGSLPCGDLDDWHLLIFSTIQFATRSLDARLSHLERAAR